MNFPPKLRPTETVAALWQIKADLARFGPARDAAIPIIARALQSEDILEKACAACNALAERIDMHRRDAEQYLTAILDEDCDLDGVTLLQLLEAMQFNQRLRSHPTSLRLLETWSKSSETGHEMAASIVAQHFD